MLEKYISTLTWGAFACVRACSTIHAAILDLSTNLEGRILRNPEFAVMSAERKRVCRNVGFRPTSNNQFIRKYKGINFIGTKNEILIQTRYQ